MFKVLKDFALVILTSLVLTTLFSMVNEGSLLLLIKASPTVLSVFLAGLVTMLTLLLVHNSRDLSDFILFERIQKGRQIEHHRYLRYLRSMKKDFFLLLLGLIFSIVALILQGKTVPMKVGSFSLTFHVDLWFSLVGLTLGFGVMVDVVEAIFALNELRYALTSRMIQMEEGRRGMEEVTEKERD